MAQAKLDREESQAGAPDLTDDLARLRGMVEQHRVEDARAYAKELEQRWPDSDAVRHWARVLAPPVARVVKGVPNRSFAAEHAWLKEHGKEYPGCWIAVLGDTLVAADSDPGVVMRRIRENPETKDALLHFQPGPRP